MCPQTHSALEVRPVHRLGPHGSLATDQITLWGCLSCRSALTRFFAQSLPWCTTIVGGVCRCLQWRETLRSGIGQGSIFSSSGSGGSTKS